jgi:hypothetical protein
VVVVVVLVLVFVMVFVVVFGVVLLFLVLGSWFLLPVLAACSMFSVRLGSLVLGSSLGIGAG